MSYIKYNVNISKGQEDKLQNGIKSKKAVSLRLSKDDLVGTHMLLLTQGQINSVKKAMSRNEGVTLKLSARQVKANLQVEGGFLGMLASLRSYCTTMARKNDSTWIGYRTDQWWC